MSVVRVKRHRERFTVLSTATLRLPALSLKARGLWALCLSYPDDWEFKVPHLRTLSARDGRDAVQSALRELEAAGLARLETVRDGDGRIRGKRWTIYEEAALNPLARGAEEGRQETEGEGATDERETGPSVEGEGHRQTGLPSDGPTDRRVIRPTANPHLRNNKQHERTSPRKNKQQQASAGAPARGASPLRTLLGGAAAALREGDGGDAAGEDPALLLLRRGVETAVADELARAHGAEAVRQAVALYDERRRGPKPPAGPGWLVAALRRGYAREQTPSATPLLSHPEMLRWCEANGGLHRTAEFEPLRQPGGIILFRRREG